ncbi:MAG: hypothetical protein K0V04_42785, partial [Deltaproteobacteria bacterium]|nr:hypothetical protein [Deltaproteobacteria bacterium]
LSSIGCDSDGCQCEPEPQCCLVLCDNNGPIQVSPPPTSCGGISCDEFVLPTGCAVTLGAGKAEDFLNHSCDIADSSRYMTGTQPDLTETFECVALVGAGGDGDERPMEAMTQAIGQQTSANGCHEGFCATTRSSW